MYVIIYNMQAVVNKKQTREYNNMKQNTLSNLILIAYLLMMIVSLVSAVDLFMLSHPSFAFGWIMSVAIEISIAALLIVNRKAPGIKSVLYVLGFITLFQICANTYSAYIHIENISPFAELFALDEWEVIDQKRMLAFATGGVLPAICLALIYIQNEVREQTETNKTNNKEHDDKAYNIEGDQIPSDDEDGGEAEEASSLKSHIDQSISESESEEVPTPQQQDESAKDADINTEPEEQTEIATEQLSETDESNDQSEDTAEPEAAVEEPKKRKYTKKSTSKSTSKTTKKTSKKTKTSKSNKKLKASKKVEEQTSADEVSVTDVPESDPDSQSQESVAELAERLNDIRRGKHNPVSNGYSMML